MTAKFPFTDLKIQSLPEGEFWDSKLGAFGLRVGKRTKTFLLIKGNRRVKIASYPATSLAEARRKALTLKGSQVNGGTDLTLEEAIELFYRTHCHSYRPSSLYQTQHLLKKLEPLYGKKLGAVTTHDLFAIIDRQKRVAANLTFGAARTFFRFCARRRLIEKSPLQDLGKPHKTQSRSRVLTDDELRAIHRACVADGGTFSKIVLLLMYSGQRRGEISAIQSSWLQCNSTPTITFPSNVAKNGREHTIPLNSLTSQLIEPLLQTPSLLFPATGKPKKPFNNWSKSKNALDKLCGVKDWTLHDLRRTYASIQARLGTPVHVIERLLNHVSGQISGVAAVYNRYDYMPEMREATERYEEFWQRILGAKNTNTLDNF
jgi:integrase